MAYFVVQALSNCACVSWCKEILQTHLNSWRDSSQTFITFLYELASLFVTCNIWGQGAILFPFSHKYIMGPQTIRSISHTHLMVGSFTIFSRSRGKAIPSQDWTGISSRRLRLPKFVDIQHI
jgi:hypothetical protein